ncbi:Calcium-activated chloride channel regulator 2 [Nymphon striatum]|nr:Calcium-activated chloride channel regulator 2 [Nymphon striatum]
MNLIVVFLCLNRRTKASAQLENLAAQTGGKVYYFPDHTDSPAALDEAFIALSAAYADEDSENLMITSESRIVSKSVPVEGSAIIDQTVGINTKFLFTGKNIKAMDVSIIDPNGKVYKSGTPNSLFHDSTQSLIFDVEDAQAGIWKYEVKNEFGSPNGDKFDVSLTTEPRQKNPIKVRTWMLSQQVQFPYKATIYAEILKSQKPVIQATVQAFIIGPNGNRYNISLHDNGVGADINKDDGIYCSYFTAHDGNGRYSVSVTAKNEGHAFLIESPVVSAAPAFPNVPNINKIKQKSPKKYFSIDEFTVIETRAQSRPQEMLVPAANFQRASMVGSFKVTNWDMVKADRIPPTRVTDLEALHILEDTDTKVVRLTWTSPMVDQGGHKDFGVDIRASGNQDLLYKSFPKGYQIKDNDIVDGSLEAQTIGFNNVTINISSDQIPSGQKMMNIYFALRHKDLNGNVAEISNIAYVTVGMAPVKQVKLAPPSTLESGNMPKIVGIVAGCIVGALLLVLGAIMAVRAWKSSQTDDLENSY